MNYFEKCKKRIEKGSRIENGGCSLIIEDDLIIHQRIDAEGQDFYEVEFINVKVPLTDIEANELYKLAEIKKDEIYSHRAQTILEML